MKINTLQSGVRAVIVGSKSTPGAYIYSEVLIKTLLSACYIEASLNVVVNASSVGKPFGFFFRVFQSWHVRRKKDEEQCGIQNREV